MLKRLDYWASALEKLPDVREVVLKKIGKRYEVKIRHGTHNFMGTSGKPVKVFFYLKKAYKELK